MQQELGDFGVLASTDQMRQWMEYLFVGALDSSVSEPVAGLGELMSIINGAILSVASVLLAYNVIAGIAQSAHEGKILGKRWSSLWAPVRPVIGLAMLIPLPSGYAAIQVLVLSIAGLGVSLANAGWAVVVEGVANGTTSITAAQVPEARGMIRELMRREVCWQALDRQAAVMDMPVDIRRTRITDAPAVLSQTPGSASWDYGPICGTVSVTLPNQGAASLPVARAVALQIEELALRMRPAARRLAYSTMPGTGVEFAPASPPVSAWLRNYSTVVGQAVAEARSAQDTTARAEFARQARTGGFVYAGTWYNTVASLNSDFLQAATLRPEFTGPDIHRLPDLGGGQEVVTVLGAFDGWWRTYVEPAAPPSVDAVLATEGDSDWERLISPGKWQWIYDQLNMAEDTAFDNTDGTNPLAELTGFGHKLLWTGQGVILAATLNYSALKGAENAAQSASNIPVVGWFGGTAGSALTGAATGTFEYLKEFFFFCVGGMIVAGAALAYWLPLVPYVLWFIALIGFLIFLAEAVVASTLWAFAHVRMDGEGIAGEAGKTGYEMVFNLLTRPILMVTGLVIGYSVFYIAAKFLGETYYAAMRGATGSHIVGLIGLLVLTVIYVYLFVLAANKSFALIHVLPDRVAIWAGAGRGVQPLGEESDLQRGSNVVLGGVVQKADNATSTSRYHSRMLGRAGDGGGQSEGGKSRNRISFDDTI